MNRNEKFKERWRKYEQEKALAQVTVEYDQEDHDQIRSLLLGRKVKKVSDDELELDNGVLLKIEPNEGAWPDGTGDYVLKELNGIDNAITSVEFTQTEMPSIPEEDIYYDDARSYKIFVFADAVKVNMVRVEGDDGNGYYGTGYHINVRFPTIEEREQHEKQR